ncbi:hypothetical protein QUA54_25000 [Microcoleus sp. MOSTC5]|uniref:hypothetical protein n=1 Tax=Microcoleus sp. MOSTC5 TaxID=3055378 RepID=UPI002FD01857
MKPLFFLSNAESITEPAAPAAFSTREPNAIKSQTAAECGNCDRTPSNNRTRSSPNL